MRLIIVFDDSNDHSSSNAFRFCGALDHSDQQITYQSVRWDTINRLEASVSDGYAYITYNYLPGDKVFIFGFAGGAFAARALANLVARFGVLLSGDVSHKAPVSAYKDGKLDDFKVRRIKPTETCDSVDFHFPPRVYDVEIEVVGCWETTSSLAASAEFEHFDISLRKGIKHAFHALALDECRGPFTPTLWRLPDDPTVANTIDLRQCWFPGAHANVGGGYKDKALANVTMAWMMDMCRPFLNFKPSFFPSIVECGRSPGKGLGDKKGEFDSQYQGWGRGMCYDSYSEGQTWTWKTRTPGAYGSGTKETMHASARERWSSSRKRALTTGPSVWNPKALEGFTPRKIDGSDEWEWVKNGGGDPLVIPEAPFPTTEGSYEWQLRYGIPSESAVVPKVIESLEIEIPKYRGSFQRAVM